MDILNKNTEGDFLNIVKLIPDNYIDLTVTSSPYDKLRNYSNKRVENIDVKFQFDSKGVINELFRITKEGGVVVWVVGDQVIDGGESGNSFKQALEFMNAGFKLYDTMIYLKNGSPYPERRRYSQVFEYMFVFSKGRPKTVNLIKDKKNKWAGSSNFGKRVMRQKDGTLKEMPKFIINGYGARLNVWKYNTGKNYSTKDKFAFKHPSIFPEQLSEDHILTWSNEGDIVLDPMVGSGTTVKMAKMNNRNFIGIDINKEYIDIANKRILEVQPYSLLKKNMKIDFIKFETNTIKTKVG